LLRQLQALAGLVLLLLAGPARAILGGSGIDPNTVDSPWAGVGSITTERGGTFSGAVVGRNLVLTAAHVVAGDLDQPANIRFNLNFGDTLSHSFEARAIHILPQYQGTHSGPGGVWFGDMALVELDRDIPQGVPVYELFTGRLAELHGDDALTLVGYGAGGSGDAGPLVPSNPGIKRVGRNHPESQIARRPDQPELLLFDYDPPAADQAQRTSWSDLAEAGLAGGDSGSPVFVRDGDAWKILGVATFNAGTADSGGSTTAYGALGGATFVAPYQDWIDDVIRGIPVREAQASPRRRPALWLVAGLFGLAMIAGLLLRTRRKKSPPGV